MKKNLSILAVITMFAVLTSVFALMPSTWKTFFMGFGVSFCFWALMLAPAFGTKNN